MALTFPYALDFLAKCLLGPDVPLRLIRFDEMSGGGDGRRWSAQLATPLWGVSYGLYAKHAAEAREINAKVNALDGMSKTLLWADPYYTGPASGVTTGLGAVKINGIRRDRGAIGLSALPAKFVLSAGDYLSISYAGGRVYFGQFAEGGTAGVPGGLGHKEIRPYLPLSIADGATVELVRPAFQAKVEDYQPFSSFRGRWGNNASITLIQAP